MWGKPGDPDRSRMISTPPTPNSHVVLVLCEPSMALTVGVREEDGPRVLDVLRELDRALRGLSLERKRVSGNAQTWFSDDVVDVPRSRGQCHQDGEPCLLEFGWWMGEGW